MEACGLLAILILIGYHTYPGRVRTLEKKVKKLEKYSKSGREDKEGNEMSRLIQDLVGKKCMLETEDDTFVLAGGGMAVCDVLDADDDWVKLAYEDKKNRRVTKLVRVDAIVTVDVLEGN